MININGKVYYGNNVTINNNKVYIDGKLQDTGEDKQINIVVEGDVTELKVDACNEVKILGNSGSISTVSGDVNIKGGVSGNVTTVSGDVSCGSIGGSVKTVSGDINHR